MRTLGHMAARTVSLHVTLTEADYLALGYEAVRRRTGKGTLLLSLAGPGLAKLRRAEQARREQAPDVW
jgi:hypothetical protein